MNRYKPDPFHFPCLSSCLQILVVLLSTLILMVSCVRFVQAATTSTEQPSPWPLQVEVTAKDLGITWVPGMKDYNPPKPTQGLEICDPDGNNCRWFMVGYCLPGSDLDGDGTDDVCTRSISKD